MKYAFVAITLISLCVDVTMARAASQEQIAAAMTAACGPTPWTNDLAGVEDPDFSFKDVNPKGYGSMTDAGRAAADCTSRVHNQMLKQATIQPDATNGPIDCDFDKPVGQCTGRIEIVSTHGSNKSYATEVRVSSSAAACSKVEYFVDNTPYTTVLAAANSEPESLSGTHPISSQDIEFKTCTAFATQKGK